MVSGSIIDLKAILGGIQSVFLTIFTMIVPESHFRIGYDQSFNSARHIAQRLTVDVAVLKNSLDASTLALLGLDQHVTTGRLCCFPE